MKCAVLTGLLRQIAAGDVDAVARDAFEHAQSFRGSYAAGEGACGEQDIPERADVFICAPELEARRLAGKTADQVGGHAADPGLEKPEHVGAGGG